MNFKIDATITFGQALCSIVYTPFASRHWQKGDVVNRLIAVIEFFPGISATPH